MTSESFLKAIHEVTTALDQQHIPYAVTGSVASSLHGEPVTSLDIDFVVQMLPEHANLLAATLTGRMYADAEALRDAAAQCGMANLYDFASGYKIDLSILANTPYHAEVMRRRVRVTHPTENVSFWVVSAEDIILMKLIWRKDTQSQKQWDNAISVARVQGARLDWAYLQRWAQEVDVQADLEALMRETGIS